MLLIRMFQEEEFLVILTFSSNIILLSTKMEILKRILIQSFGKNTMSGSYEPQMAAGRMKILKCAKF